MVDFPNPSISISLASSGRKTIPEIKPDPIIQIHGRNGVGKSMAANMLEIASGNYLFQSESQFQKLKEVIESCSITIAAAGGNEIFEVNLTPATWKFDRSMNTINPMTIGDYKYNEKELKFKDFKKRVNVRVIRGDESLTQQVAFFKDIFVSKINQRLENLDKVRSLTDGYKNWLDQQISEQDVKNYEQKQEAFNALLDKRDSLNTTIGNRELSLAQLDKQFPLLEELQFRLENQVEDLEKEKQQRQENLESFKAQLEEKYKEKLQLEDKLNEIQGKSGQEVQKWIDSKASLEKKLSKSKERLKSVFDAGQVEKIFKATDQQATITYIQGQIGTLEQRLIKVKEDFDLLSEKSQRVLGINGFLSRLEEVCNQASKEAYADDKFITVYGSNEEMMLSPTDLLAIITTSKQEFSNDTELADYEKEVMRVNQEIQVLKDQKGCLGEIEGFQKKIITLTNQIKSKGNMITDLFDQQAKISIPDKIQEIEGLIDEINASILSNQDALEKLGNNIEELSQTRSENVIAAELNNLGCGLKDIKIETVAKKKADVQREISKNEHQIEDQKALLEETDQKFGNAKKQVDEVIPRFRAIGKKFGYPQFGPFIEYFRGHVQKLNKFSKMLDNMTSKLNSLLKDMEAITSGKSIKSQKNAALINNEFDRTFRELYGQPEFFKYVFTGYTNIKRFDIANRSIIFETNEGMEETRDLSEFSSGEKTYAYCRAIISMIATSAKYSIIVLDESYALLDHDHSENLYEFQKLQIAEGGIAKFINILPLKEDIATNIEKLRSALDKEIQLGNEEDQAILQGQLQEQETFLQEVNDWGYYQKIIPLT